MKKLVLGILIGCLSSLFITTYAAEKLAFKTVSTKVYVNGKNLNNNLPSITLDGNLYLPAKQLCNELKILYTEDTKLNRVDIGSLNPTLSNYIKNDNAIININNFSIETNYYGLVDEKGVKRYVLLNIDIVNSGTEPIKYCAYDFVMEQKISTKAKEYPGRTLKLSTEIGGLSDDYEERLIQQPTISETVYNTLQPNEKHQGNLVFTLYDDADINTLKLVYKKKYKLDIK